MRKSFAIACLTIVLMFGQAIAQKKTNSETSIMQKPAPTVERAKLGFLVGTFKTETRIPPMPSLPKGATGKGTSVVAWALDSMFLLIQDQSFNSLLGNYKGHGLLGFDPQSREFVLSMFNNFGDRPSYSGNFVGDTLVLEAKVPYPGGTFDQKLLWNKDGQTVRLRVLNNLGKGYQLNLEQTSIPDVQGTK
jgi:hypothetical protein